MFSSPEWICWDIAQSLLHLQHFQFHWPENVPLCHHLLDMMSKPWAENLHVFQQKSATVSISCDASKWWLNTVPCKSGHEAKAWPNHVPHWPYCWLFSPEIETHLMLTLTGRSEGYSAMTSDTSRKCKCFDDLCVATCCQNLATCIVHFLGPRPLMMKDAITSSWRRSDGSAHW